MQNKTSTPGAQTASASKGAWVTLHFTEAAGHKTIMGYMTGGEGGMLKLTKYVLSERDIGPQGERGITTTIHEGVWLFNPQHIWLIEHEKTIPTPGFEEV